MIFRLAPKLRKLMPHQERGLDYFLNSTHPLLCMEMRTGKTLTTIRADKELPRGKPNLVLAPLTVLSAWQRELTLEGEFWVAGYGLTAAKRMQLFQWVWSNPHPTKRIWLLMNYESLLASGESYISRSGRHKRKTPLIAQAP